MAAGYIPAADGPFDAWQRGFAGYVTEHFLELGLSVEQVTQLKDATLPWEAAYEAHGAARAAARAACVAKVVRRGAYDGVIRELVRQIQVNELVTDAQRAALGVTVRDSEPTPVVAPTTRPLVVVDFSERLRHTLRYADEATPTRRARPRGVMGVEVWVKVAPVEPSADSHQPSAGESQSSILDPQSSPSYQPSADSHQPSADDSQSSILNPQSSPSGPEELEFLLVSTRTPAVVEYDGADGGLTAHYMLRWLSTRGEAGPWSETASATIGV